MEETGVHITVTALEDLVALQEAINQSSLLVNATSLGMDATSNPLPDEISLLSNLLVADIIYQPFETPLLKRARQEGLSAVNGLGMLLYQAAIAFELWTGQAMPVDVIWPKLEYLVKT